jgi:ferric-dicitrate binding protein FerR (iron transport regulator)
MTTDRQSSDGDEQVLGRLLGEAGARASAPADVRDSVRAAVHAEWQTVVASRKPRQRRWLPAAGAAIAATAVLGISLLLLRPEVAPATVASVVRTVGTVELRAPGDAAWQMLNTEATLLAGSELRTPRDGRVALALASGLSLRLDGGSRLALSDAAHATLASGAVYVDSGHQPADRTAPLEIDTGHGRVAHLGTQYEARLAADALVVSVREGRVSVATGARVIEGSAGERLTIGPGGVQRTSIATQAEDWQWAGAIAPGFEIEGRSLEAFLVWAARETGRTLEFADEAARTAASELTLHGSIDGLDPQQALETVLATTALGVSVGPQRIDVGLAHR